MLIEKTVGCPQPSTLCTCELECEDLLNLLDENQRKVAGISLSEMEFAWELIVAKKQKPPTWEMAERLIGSGFAGIIAPSYAKNASHGGQNIILWDWQDHPPHQVRLIDDNNRLPKNQESWK